MVTYTTQALCGEQGKVSFSNLLGNMVFCEASVFKLLIKEKELALCLDV